MPRARAGLLLPLLILIAGCGSGVATGASVRATATQSQPAIGSESLASAIGIAQHLYFNELEGTRVHNDLRFVAGDHRLKLELLRGEYAQAEREAQNEMFDNPIRHITRIAVLKGNREVVNATWNSNGVFVARPLEEPLRFAGHDLGTLRVSVQDIVGLIKLIKAYTGYGSVVRGGSGQSRASEPALLSARLPNSGNVQIGARRYETASFAAPGWAGEALRVWVLKPA